MALPHHLKKAFIGACALLATGAVAAPAKAIDTGCRTTPETIAQLRSDLQSEGQVEIIKGIRNSVDQNWNTFMVNAKGEGYHLEIARARTAGQTINDIPDGPVKAVCLIRKFDGARVNTNPNFERPVWGLVGGNHQYDQWFTSQEKSINERVLLRATTQVKLPNGSYRDGGDMFVTLRSSSSPRRQNGGSVVIASGDNRIDLGMDIWNISTTANYNWYASLLVQVAEGITQQR
jgi:hypothetical protein